MEGVDLLPGGHDLLRREEEGVLSGVAQLDDVGVLDAGLPVGPVDGDSSGRVDGLKVRADLVDGAVGGEEGLVSLGGKESNSIVWSNEQTKLL